jgi:hypothetical protein
MSITHKFGIGGHEGYITVGLYPNGAPGEIFIRMAKEGSTISGLMDSFATAISLALQHGVPLKVLCEKFAHTRFEPSGWTGSEELGYAKSIMDYLFRWMQLRFLSGQQLDLFANLKQPTLAAGSVPASTQSVSLSEQRDAVIRSEQQDAVSRSEQRDAVIRSEQRDAVNRSEQRDAVIRSEQQDAVIRSEQRDAVNRSEQRNAVILSEKNDAVILSEARSAQSKDPEGFRPADASSAFSTTTTTPPTHELHREAFQRNDRTPPQQGIAGEPQALISKDLTARSGMAEASPLETTVDRSVFHTASAMQSMYNMGDAPSCSTCGSIMTRNGSCYRCMECGSTSGCS